MNSKAADDGASLKWVRRLDTPPQAALMLRSGTDTHHRHSHGGRFFQQFVMTHHGEVHMISSYHPPRESTGEQLGTDHVFGH